MFSDANKIWQVVNLMRQSGLPRSENRTRVNSLFNGNPPYSDSECRDNRIETNVNWLEGTTIMQQARQQYNNAFMKPTRLFTARRDDAPMGRSDEWSSIVTKEINRSIKKEPRFYNAQKQVYASVPLHGIGPCMWVKSDEWCPKAIGVDDLFIPTETLQTFENLDYFAIYTAYTASELWKMTHGAAVDPGWNMAIVNQIISTLTEQMTGTSYMGNWSNWQFPEKIEEDFKQNSGYWGSDAVPVIRCYDFYFKTRNDKGEEIWERRIILDRQNNSVLVENGDLANSTDFLFAPVGRKYAGGINEILHCQYGDGCVVPPFKYHSTRSLGFLLYAVCNMQNRLRCKFNDAVFESMLWYFREVAEGDRERLEKVDLKHLGVIPQGLSWVQPNERHTINLELLTSAVNMNRGLMGEHSAAFTKTTDGMSSKEMTATEVMAQVNASSALLSSMIVYALEQEKYKYKEIFRRFCTIDHADCVEFRTRCAKQGVDLKWLSEHEDFDINPEQVMGGGNATLQMAKAQQLMNVKPQLSPQGQMIVLHKYVQAVTDDPSEADAIAPIAPQAMNTPARQVATMGWGTLMQGMPLVIGEAINPQEFIGTLMGLLENTIQGFNQQLGGMPDVYHIVGLQNVIQFIGQQMHPISQDKTQQQFTKQVMDGLGQAENFVKAYQQRLQEKQQSEAAQAQGGGAEVAKTQQEMQIEAAQAQQKMQIKQAEAQQKMLHKNVAFEQNTAHKQASTAQNLHQQAVKTTADVASKAVQTEADIRNQAAREAAQPAPTQ